MAKLLSIFLQLLWRILYLPYIALHELSHAITALLLTKHQVTVYIGSYGESKGHWQFSTGRLHWRIKYNFFNWRGGVCIMHAEFTPTYVRIIYALMGPLLPFVFSAGMTWLAYAMKWDGGIIFLLGFFCLLSFCYMIANLFPSSRPTVLSDGSMVHNDGGSILQSIQNRNVVVSYKEALADYQQKKYEKVIGQLEQGLTLKPQNKPFYQLLAMSYVQQKEYNKAKDTIQRCLTNCSGLNDNDYTSIAYLYSQAGEVERALQYYNEALKLNPKNSTALNNKGYALNLLGYYEKAIPCFNKALQIRPLFAFSYNNLGYAQMKLGQWEEGFKNLKHSHRLDMNNAYVYRNFGIYHLEKQEYAEALKQLKKAEAIDAGIPELKELLTKANDYLKE